jgi:hypothetical protein
VAFVQQILHLAQQRESFVGIGSQITVLSEKVALAIFEVPFPLYPTTCAVQHSMVVEKLHSIN